MVLGLTELLCVKQKPSESVATTGKPNLEIPPVKQWASEEGETDGDEEETKEVEKSPDEVEWVALFILVAYRGTVNSTNRSLYGLEFLQDFIVGRMQSDKDGWAAA